MFNFVKGIIIRNAANLKKMLKLEVDNAATENTTTTLKSAQTANRTITLPDLTGTIALTSENQTFTDKTIDADDNTISNLEVDNLKSGVLITNISLATSDTELPSALAVKTALEGQNEASEITFSPTVDIPGLNVQDAIEDVQANLQAHLDSTTAHDAIEITYDNTTSGLTATNVQDAIDELFNENWSSLVNSDIIPDADATYNLGNINFSFSEIYAQYIYSTANLNIFSDATTVITGTNEELRLESYAGLVAPTLRLSGADPSLTVGIKAPDALAGSYTLTLPLNDGGSGELLSTDGSGNLSWIPAPVTGANTTLSNLTSPTAINQSLLPGADLNYDLGSNTLRYNNIWGQTVSATSSFGLRDPSTLEPIFTSNQIQKTLDSTTYYGVWLASPVTISAGVRDTFGFRGRNINSTGTHNLLMFTGDANIAGNSGKVLVASGNAAGNSGNMELLIGTAVGTQGDFRFHKLGTTVTVGHVWTATSADGKGYWAAAAAAGANTTLSNLTSPTSINQDLLPFGFKDIGSSGNRWLYIYGNYFDGQEFRIGNNVQFRTVNNLDMPDAGTGTFSGIISAGVIRTGITTDNKLSTDNSQKITFTTGNTVDGNSGDIILRTGVPTGTGTRGKVSVLATSLDMNSSKIINVTDPTSAQDAATKNYVDNNSGVFAIVSVSGSTTLSDGSKVAICNSASPITVTLPLAANNTGKVIHIKQMSTGLITVDGNGSETIDDSLTQQVVSLYDNLTLVSDGTEWYRI